MAGSYFRDLNVSYWSSEIYNDTFEDIDAAIDETFDIPLLEKADDYVCCVERMELSGNNIYLYDPASETAPFQYPATPTMPIIYYTTMYITYQTTNNGIPFAYIDFFTPVYNLTQLVDYMNQWGLSNRGLANLPRARCADFQWALEQDGRISMVNFAANANQNAQTICFNFSHEKLASIFGMPRSAINYTTQQWTSLFCQPGPWLPMKFMTKSSRIDLGQTPSIILLRSNMPLQSDQSSQAKTNIVTDFSLAISANNSYSSEIETVAPDATGLTQGYRIVTVQGTSFSTNGGGMIIYIPQERRWLNFSSPIPIIQIRTWVQVVRNDGNVENVTIPPGGKFSLKLGFYSRNAN